MTVGSRRPSVRGDLVAMEGYHSPQVSVPVRLNTNESPFPPPPGFATDLAAAIAGVEWHRYPDRAATALRTGIAALHDVPLEQVFVIDAAGTFWRASDVGTGEKKRLEPSTAEAFGRWFDARNGDAGPVRRAAPRWPSG